MREVLPRPLVPVVEGLADGTVTGSLGPGYGRVVLKVVK